MVMMFEREIEVARRLALHEPNTADDVVLGNPPALLGRASHLHGAYGGPNTTPLRPMTCLVRSGLRFDARDCVDQVM